MVTKVKAGATEPVRIDEKAAEARFFIERMKESQQAHNGTVFGYYLSAFLNAFRSTAYRLYGVTRTRNGEAAKTALKKQLHTNPQIGLLLSKSNVEIHENGVVIWQNNKIMVVPKIEERWPSRFKDRFHEPERWQARWQSLETKLVFRGWQFVGEPPNLVELCRGGLQELEKYAQRYTN